MSDPYAALAKLLFGTGMRFGEATALRISDVDLMGRRPNLRVTRAWKRQPDMTYAEGGPKTTFGRRTITLSPELVELLIPFVSGKRGDELLIPAVFGGQMLNSTFHDVGWAPAIRKAHAAGLLAKEPRVHDLRHAHASVLIAEGLPPLAISRRLGHKSITTTYDLYGHLMPEFDDEINAAVDRSLARRD